MKFATPFLFLRDWYLARRRIWKILIAVAGGLVAVVCLYVLARAVQYSTSPLRAASFLPDRADVFVELPDLSGTFGEIEKTEAWRTFRERILRDRTIRVPLNETLEEAGLPTIDDLEDLRFHRESGGWFTRNGIDRLAGRDLAAAMVLPRQGRGFCVATKVRFGDYLLLPFAWMAPGLLGAEKETVKGYSCLRRTQNEETIWITTSGPVAVVANSRELMEAALERGEKREPFEGFCRIEVDFTRSPDLATVRQELALGLLGPILRDVDLSRATAMILDGNVEGNDVTVRTRWRGVDLPSAESPVNFLEYAPEDSAGFVATTSGVSDVWRWMLDLLATERRDEGMMVSLLKEAVRLFKEHSFEEKFLPHFREGSAWILGTESFTDFTGNTLRYPAAVLVLPTGDSEEAYRTLQEITYNLTSAPETKWRYTRWQGHEMAQFEVPGNWDVEPLARICFSPLPQVLLIGNNPDFLMRVIDTAVGQARSLKGSRRAKVDFDAHAVVNFFMAFGPLCEGLDGPIPILADKMVDNDEEQRKLRAEMMREGLTPAQIDEQFQSRLRAKIGAKEDELRGQTRFLRHLKQLELQAKTLGNELEIRAVLRLR